MLSKVKSAADILRHEGGRALTEKSTLYMIRQTPGGEQFLYNISLRQLRKRMAAEDGLADILDTVLDVRPGYPPYRVLMMQLRDEIRALAELAAEHQPRTALEIGTANGGSFYVWTRHLDSLESMTSLDLPDGPFGGGYNQRKTDLFREFATGTEMHFHRRDSHDPATYKAVAETVADGVDFLFLDGDHTYEGVKDDFETYSQLVNDGGMIALHDIATHPDDPDVVERRRASLDAVDGLEERHLSWGEAHTDCNVDRFWAELRDEYETTEIVSHPEQTWAGIGVVHL